MTIEQVKDDIASGKSKMVYYSTKTLWWTHLDEDLEKSTEKGKEIMLSNLQREIDSDIPEGQKKILKAHKQSLIDSSIPLDPSGAPLMQINEPTKWVSEAEGNPAHFGKHELSAFMFCHHQNIKGIFPMSWDQVNKFIDEIDVIEEKDKDEEE